ncbi:MULTISPECIES: Tex family protein [Mycobacterium]|uniref:RNA-binding transcriptional accessory protein n=1 Tax=Mycobacterium kiyosense TaxID=2871094 RepID=A0A9P3Q1X0_9MYCO|nr:MULTISPECIES: Tex family protein [Mycobacterium]BDB42703.1 RNA-binding transcriptional accessory protein [Mycobacterium kiyosense]BDE14045.1 RNA-binding transcriptional accessory protein [Mycobacterium sp. 20KCMC460]GLB81199.1 RNA-binding transcriptional accessory protein [Mycobacterium kiyosense]GLB88229.1 RNA-binding transcriptional accessory protein [Mycobacterium kiyosense]GLB94535.1 RNA-binding transcriptional accessory protein [Mycobacterium kiyosense]
MTQTAAIKSVNARLAAELAIGQAQVDAAVRLLDEGATVPFIARYRKEATGSLDDGQLRTLEERLRYVRELDERRAAVLASIEEQGKLTDSLKAALLAADTKARVEDIYLPYKPKRRTKAQIAREAGLQPLAELLLADPTLNPETAATDFVGSEFPDVADAAAALEGARHILVERVAEDAELVGAIRETFWSRATLRTAPWSEESAKSAEAQKFRDYFDFAEAVQKMPSHRVLAVLRGEKEKALSFTFDGGQDDEYEAMIARTLGVNLASAAPATRWLADTVSFAWRTRLMFSASVDARMRLRQRAEADAVAVFARNLKDLLLAAPAGARTTLGLDPGFRTGVKVAVVDGTGKVLDTCAVYPHQPQRQWDSAKATLAALVLRHGVELIAVGNGTASRETDALANELIADIRAAGSAPRVPVKAMVSEAGASVYSASAYAAHELPELDVTLRGAVSIARRLQDPLAELVKIEPKSIGVGQYQHDVTPGILARSLDAVVEDAVNGVGVDLNTASVPLLARVSGISESLAEAIVAHRDQTGPFPNRRALLAVPRLGPKAFEQCAGFLRIRGGDDPLDASGVHPEAYPVVRRILDRSGMALAEIIGDERALRKLRPADFADDRFGIPTVTDIIAELEKPGRDPRPAFSSAKFAAGVEKIADLKPGMVLEGVVTNVAAFGAFVDVGVHQDGLVHVSAMAERYVSDPHEVVRSGQVVRVKVMEVDVERQRIGLSLRLNDDPQRDRRADRPPARGDRDPARQRRGSQQTGSPRRRDAQPGGGSNSMARALRDAGFG